MAGAQSQLKEGAVLAGTYRITKLLGRGGMGAVWLAEHLRLERKNVAIKVLHSHIAGDRDAVARFRREAQIASRLGHPNIVEVHDINTLPDGSSYLVLEFLAGESLSQRLRRGALSLAQTKSITRQIGSALQAAHSENIIHRDLKPPNVFLCPTEAGGYATEQVKVLDFGISKIRGSQTIETQTTAILGTPQYMAPEQAVGHNHAVDARTDLFALGAMVYEMLSGQAAFVGQSIPQVMYKVVYEEPASLTELVPGLPESVVAAVERALAKKQSDRFASVSEFIEALTGEPLTTVRGGPATATMMHVPAGMNAAASGNQHSGNQHSSAGTGAADDHAASGGVVASAGAGAAASNPVYAPGPAGVAASAALGAPAVDSVRPGVFAAGSAHPGRPAAGSGAHPGLPAAGSGAHPGVFAAGSGHVGAHVAGNVHAHVAAGAGVRQQRYRRSLLLGMGAAIAATVTFVLLGLPALRDNNAPVPPVGETAKPPAEPTSKPTSPTANTGDNNATSQPTTAQPATGAAKGTDSGGTDSGATVAQPSNQDEPQTPPIPPDTTPTSPQSTATTSAQTGQASDQNPSRPARKPVPKKLQKVLNRAKSLIERNPGEAIRQARKTLGTQRTTQAYEILTRAYCVKRDLGNARANIQHLRGSARRSAQRFCLNKYDIDLR